ncbi:MAG TPA: hypothetical protein VLR90_16870 [Blastocatellia bacterium]|nr:hypothetical protein [Blastocatellia bacterium]
MTTEEMERAIEALLGQSTQFNAALDRVREVVERLSESHVKSLEDMQEMRQSQVKMANDVQLLTGKIIDLTDSVTRLEAQSEADRAEMREGFNNLIIANEVTRKLAEDVAKLAIATSQRISNLESNG